MACSKGHICQCLTRILTVRRQVPVAISRSHHLTGEQFVDGVLSLARGLTELGLQRGDVVAVAALNSEWYMEWLLAVAFIGCIASPLNYRWSFKEARSAMELVKPVMLVVDESCSSWALELQRKTTMPFLRFHVFIGESPYLLSSNSVTTKDSIKRPSQYPRRFSHLWAPEDIALICFTSGTTGRPKGVSISHVALIVQSLAKIATVGYGEDDVYLHTAPLCHIGGISSCITMLMAGGCHVFIPKFDAEAAIQAIEQHDVTSLITVPAMMADLVLFFREHNISGGESIKKILNGGGGLSVELITGATRIFPYVKLISAYGMTEACSSLTFITLHDPARQNSGKVPRKDNEISFDLIPFQLGGTCVGKSPSHIELKISGIDGSSGPPSVGRILTRGTHVMAGYWDKTSNFVSKPCDHDWFDTGDIGWIDGNGDLWLIGRTKDRIKSGGENIFPEEVEAVISQHPGVSGIAVVGVPDSRLTEMVVACVRLREDWVWFDQQHVHSPGMKQLSSEILRSHCRQRKLTGYSSCTETLLLDYQIQNTEDLSTMDEAISVYHDRQIEKRGSKKRSNNVLAKSPQQFVNFQEVL